MNLYDFFTAHPKVALAFSGGVDSAYLLYAALQYGANVRAYYVKSAFQPQFELDDAMRLSSKLHADLRILDVDIFAHSAVTENPYNRCYFCKKNIFSTIAEAAMDDGYTLLIDGTNASDDVNDRPGMKVLQELSVRSPLRECGLSKEEIRNLSKDAGLFTWNKPAYACLATRIPTGEPITENKLRKTETAEAYLFSLGLTDFRVRMMGEMAKLQISEQQMPLIMEKRKEIAKELKKYYSAVLLDLEERK